ncbi:hypothetical protein PUN28_014738 [Cardiocondyla obscurior]|uniref:Uncharacterized protein n=1 Tax=Cardiocondyla obscurior TaxID=286306 RepID=A0AAW2F171_9HYME
MLASCQITRIPYKAPRDSPARNKDTISFTRECRRNNRGLRARCHISGRDEAFPRLVIRQRTAACNHTLVYIQLAFRQCQPAKGSRPFFASFVSTGPRQSEDVRDNKIIL